MQGVACIAMDDYAMGVNLGGLLRRRRWGLERLGGELSMRFSVCLVGGLLKPRGAETPVRQRFAPLCYFTQSQVYQLWCRLSYSVPMIGDPGAALCVRENVTWERKTWVWSPEEGSRAQAAEGQGTSVSPGRPISSGSGRRMVKGPFFVMLNGTVESGLFCCSKSRRRIRCGVKSWRSSLTM